MLQIPHVLLMLAFSQTFEVASVKPSTSTSGRVTMTSDPGRISAEIKIDAPEPRNEEFRTSAAYGEYCRNVSAALAPSYSGQALL